MCLNILNIVVNKLNKKMHCKEVNMSHGIDFSPGFSFTFRSAERYFTC